MFKKIGKFLLKLLKNRAVIAAASAAVGAAGNEKAAKVAEIVGQVVGAIQ